jgi:hypothetical protein
VVQVFVPHFYVFCGTNPRRFRVSRGTKPVLTFVPHPIKDRVSRGTKPVLTFVPHPIKDRAGRCFLAMLTAVCLYRLVVIETLAYLAVALFRLEWAWFAEKQAVALSYVLNK